MGAIAFYVFLAGALCAAAGIILQMSGSAAFSRFNARDSKELAGLSGLRVSAIFGIAVGLIFSGSHTHYTEAKRNLLEEVQQIGTFYILVSNSPGYPNSRRIRENLLQYAQASALELDRPESADQSAETTNALLFKICKLATANPQNEAATDWLQTQLQGTCSRLIELRGKKRVWALTNSTETPFWVFFAIAFGFLAFLLGVFEKRPLNLIFSGLFYFVAGATVILIYWMSDPYHGPSQLNSAPFAQLIAKLHTLDKGS